MLRVLVPVLLVLSTSVAAHADDVPTISFHADWSVTQSAPLEAGGRVRVHYDVSRLPRCRTWYHGAPAWEILGSWNVDGAFVHAIPMTFWTWGEADRVGVDRIIPVPAGRDLSLWFYASDAGGCREWDSSYGRDFHFAITNPHPTAHFRRDWSVAVDGVPTAGRTLLVDYDLARLPACRAMYNGYDSWDVVMHYRYDGGAIQQVSLTSVVDTYRKVAAPARLVPPAGARVLEAWFENMDRTGCHAWDSDFGRNFRVTLR